MFRLMTLGTLLVSSLWASAGRAQMLGAQGVAHPGQPLGALDTAQLMDLVARGEARMVSVPIQSGVSVGQQRSAGEPAVDGIIHCGFGYWDGETCLPEQWPYTCLYWVLEFEL